mmetsp:Transcript_13674/g.39088  ORF Transcript_13674/g.39088 Transcript_13674/m.39088 type:complete len:248 (-) Transcript_13674:280-1023(-)
MSSGALWTPMTRRRSSAPSASATESSSCQARSPSPLRTTARSKAPPCVAAKGLTRRATATIPRPCPKLPTTSGLRQGRRRRWTRTGRKSPSSRRTSPPRKSCESTQCWSPRSAKSMACGRWAPLVTSRDVAARATTFIPREGARTAATAGSATSPTPETTSPECRVRSAAKPTRSPTPCWRPWGRTSTGMWRPPWACGAPTCMTPSSRASGRRRRPRPLSSRRMPHQPQQLWRAAADANRVRAPARS